MISKNKIKFFRSLQQKKYRNESGLFIAEGKKLVEELINSSIFISTILTTSSYKSQNILSRKGKTFELIEVSEKELLQISALKSPSEVIAIAKTPNYQLNYDEIANSLSIVLDEIKDPGNLGTIIRIADWFGINNIICSKNCVDAFNPKVVQSSMGSITRVRLFYMDLVPFVEECKKLYHLTVYGASLDGKNIYEERLSDKGLIILGNESKGISNDLSLFLTALSIPTFHHSKHQQSAESLNVAVAAGIICSEFQRRNI